MKASFYNVGGTQNTTVNVPPFTERVRKVYVVNGTSQNLYLLATDKIEIIKA